MNSETPKDAVPGPNNGTGHTAQPEGRQETPGSIGLELLEQHSDFDASSDEQAYNDSDDGINTLMSHERRLSLGEQRQILAMRRRVSDDETEEQTELQTGRRHMLWKLHNEKLLKKPGEETNGGSAVLLSDASNPDKPMYDAVLKGVCGLDPARVTLSPEEQCNVAGALTASMMQLPGFDSKKADFSAFTFALNDGGDQLFMIHHLDPAAPDALRTSIPLDVARTQPLMASSELLFAFHQPTKLDKTGLEQGYGIPGENSPRMLA